MAKSFTEQIEKKNNYRSSFPNAGPVKINLDNFDSIISVNIDEVIPPKPLKNKKKSEPRNPSAPVKAKKGSLKDEPQKSNPFIAKGAGSSKSGNEVAALLSAFDLPSNARKMLLAIVENGNIGEWVRMSYKRFTNEFNVHSSEYSNAKKILINRGLIEYKQDTYEECSNRKTSFYRVVIQ